jgi:hypothetical protein
LINSFTFSQIPFISLLWIVSFFFFLSIGPFALIVQYSSFHCSSVESEHWHWSTIDTLMFAVSK